MDNCFTGWCDRSRQSQKKMSCIIYRIYYNIQCIYYRQNRSQSVHLLGGASYQEASSKGSKVAFCQLVQDQGQVPRGHAPPAFGPFSVKTIQETSEILIFAEINGRINQLVSNG